MRKLFVILFVLSHASWGAEPSDLEFTQSRSLPSSMIEFLSTAGGFDSYALASWINPFYLQGDFNGDGSRDTAVLIKEKSTEKHGILIIHGEAGPSFILGAGHAIGNGGDDFYWMDAWYVFPQGAVGESLHVEGEPPTLRGDALMVMKTEAASGVIYWTGREYVWYQQGD